MKQKTLLIIISLLLLTAYYSVLFYIARSWYLSIPETVEHVFGSPFFMTVLYSAYVVVPVHFFGLFWLAYTRKINPGVMIMCLMLPIALAALFFPAK